MHSLVKNYVSNNNRFSTHNPSQHLSLFDSDDTQNDKRKFVADKGDYVDLDVGVGRQLKVGKNVSCREKEN